MSSTLLATPAMRMRLQTRAAAAPPSAPAPDPRLLWPAVPMRRPGTPPPEPELATVNHVADAKASAWRARKAALLERLR